MHNGAVHRPALRASTVGADDGIAGRSDRRVRASTAGASITGRVGAGHAVGHRLPDLRMPFRDAPAAAPRHGGSFPYPTTMRDFLAGIGTLLTTAGLRLLRRQHGSEAVAGGAGQAARRAACRCRGGAIARLRDQDRGQLDHSVSIDAMFVTAYREFYCRQNVLAAAIRRTFASPAGSTAAAADRCRNADRNRFLPLLAATAESLSPPDGRARRTQGSQVTVLSFARSRDKGAFWEDDNEMLFRLLPHLRQGLRAGRHCPAGSGRRAHPARRASTSCRSASPCSAAPAWC